MSIVKTLFVDDVDLRSLDGMRVKKMQLRAPGNREGTLDKVIGADGLIPAPLPFAAYNFSVFVRIFGDTDEEYEENFDAIATTLLGTNGGLVTLRRRLPATLTPFYVDHTAPGQFAGGLDLDIKRSNTGLAELRFVNLKGGWSRDGGTTWVAP